MSVSLRIMIFMVAVILAFVIIIILKRGRMPLKYSIVWFLPIVLLALISLIPDALWKFTELIGFQTTSNMVIGMLFLILFFICISLTIIVSGQKVKITLLIQEISLIKQDIKKGNHE